MNETTTQPAQPAVEVHDPLEAHQRPTTRLVEVPIKMLATVLARGPHKYRVTDGGLPPDARVAAAWVDVDRAGNLMVSMRVESRLWNEDTVLDRYSPAARAALRPVLGQLIEKRDVMDASATATSLGRISGTVTPTLTPAPTDPSEQTRTKAKGKRDAEHG